MYKYYVYVAPGHIYNTNDLAKAREYAEYYGVVVRETGTDDILFYYSSIQNVED